MKYLTFIDWPEYPLVFLVPQLRKAEIQKEYLDAHGIPTDDVKVISLHFTGKKTPVGEMKRYITEALVPELEGSGARYLVVADASYYKVLTGESQAEANVGYVRNCLYGSWKVVYVPWVRSIFYDPEKVRGRIQQSLTALKDHIQGKYQDPGVGIIKFEAYPKTTREIADWLEKLLEMDRDLTVDIEAFGLKHYEAGIGTISFCWSKHEGIAFPVDYVPIPGATQAPYGRQIRNEEVRNLLRSFFRRFKRKAIYHNISYDAYVLIYQLFMEDILDQVGMLNGLEIMLRNWDDTQHITYLATNTCAGNELGLKANSQEFSGNYSVEVKDITKVPLDTLLRYNLIDGLSTWYVKEKNEPIMDRDQQREIYETLFKPSTWDIIQMQLTGLPLDMERTKEVAKILQKDCDDALVRIRQTRVAQEFLYRLREQHVEKRNATLKKKRITLECEETLAVEFNPNSDQQLQDLLYNMLGLPVLDKTPAKQPAVGAKTLKKLIHKTDSQDVKDFLEAMVAYAKVYKLITAFIPAMLRAKKGPDGWHYLFGSFKLGGTVSGRLSSKGPNLQNLPAKGKYAKLIKSCFKAPSGWVLVGLDFASLEDRISALTTKDPNKLKVYTDGYDGHCLRAYAYFGDAMPDIDPDSVASINSIAELYPDFRQESKTPTFLLTYGGTYLGMMEQCGFDEAKAKKIEANYHELYKVSDAWVQSKLDQAGKDGYVTVAFGLRLRTPLLEQVIRGTSKTPYEAESEARTAGNALGQSWGLLNNRASVEFMGKVRQSEYRLDIRPCAHIHDAQYYIVRDDANVILYVNKHLVEAVQWQDHPDIWHDEVRLGGNLSIYWPDWSYEIEIPNGADEAALHAALESRLERCA